MHWLLCVLIVIAIIVLVFAWRDHKEKPHLWIVVLVILIVLLIPCVQRFAGMAGAG